MFISAILITMPYMRLAEFHQRVTDVFGSDRGPWILHSHTLSEIGSTADEALENGVAPSLVWDRLCQDFDVSEADYWGFDR